VSPSDEYNLGKASRQIHSEHFVGLSESFVPDQQAFISGRPLITSWLDWLPSAARHDSIKVNASPKKISPVDATSKHAIYNKSILGQDKPIEVRLLCAATP
tara:strand:- start:93 stop:395 length:303 start_codon:yes stop_codon:yes gene_type:complete